jgi:hypothetical protein
MKRIALLLAGSFLLIANVSFSQAIDDRAVIPVAVTLNSILRLNVTSGGNIEFNFNTLHDYEYGIRTSPAYQTKFNVASSVNWDVLIYSEEDNLIGTDLTGGFDGDGLRIGTNVMPVDNIGYYITNDNNIATYNFHGNGDLDNPQPLSSTSKVLVGHGTVPNAGDITINGFTIHWECGTQRGLMNDESILFQAINADRYATNVFLVLEPTSN